MKQQTILFLLLIASYAVHAQLDSTDFTNKEEYRLFQAYDDNQAFELLYLIDNNNTENKSTSKKAFYKFLDGLQSKIEGKNNKKTVKIVYETIHDNYFSKYVENPNFVDIFTKKEYNCVTASALYALAFNHLNIPFEIRELPTHVYLVVFPKSDKIILETTAAQGGYLHLNQRQIDQYKQYLISTKAITPAEANKDFFNNHILGDSIINLKQLIGIQYYNKALMYAEDESIELATPQIEKAYAFNPKDYAKSMVNYLVLKTIEINKKATPERLCKYMAKYHHYTKDRKQETVGVATIFHSVVLEKIDQKEEHQSILQLNDCLKSKIKQDSIVKEMDVIAYQSLANYSYQSLNFDRALRHLQKIYDADKNNLDIYIKDCLIRKYNNITNPYKGLDSLKHYERLFPFVANDEHILGYKAWCLLKVTYSHFELDEIDQGMLLLDQFRQTFKPETKVAYQEEMVGHFFGSISAYYFRKKDYKMAEQLLNEGLQYVPYSIVLKKKLKLLKEFLEDN